MAKVAHLILAHQNPDQVIRLAKTLVYASHDVYVHVDKKTSIGPFEELLHIPNTYLISQQKRVDWGAYNIVDATLSAMAEIVNKEPYDFINLLSGADYPLVRPSVVDHFLNSHPRQTFIEFYRQGSPWWEQAKVRTEKIHLTNYRFRGKYLLQKLINQFPFRRKLPLEFELVGHSQWFTMASIHVSYILDFVKKHPAIVRFFKHTWGADEFFFQTILYNSPFKEALMNDNLRYIDWSEHNPSPKNLTTSDFEALKRSGKFYARKFDEAFESTILNRIDSLLLRTQTDV